MKNYLLAFLISIVLSIAFGYIIIPMLKKLKVGQPILSYVKEHYSKSGTPTMGGLFFVLASIIAFFIFRKGDNHFAKTIIAVTLSFMFVGFVDDIIKIKGNNNLGLTPLKKILFQFAIAVITSILTYKSGATIVFIPFTQKYVSLGIFSIFLYVFIFLATVNSVNLLDGLDGLCGLNSFITLIATAFIILLETKNFPSLYYNVCEYENIALYNICVAGAILGFLVFNTSKASVFMGDSGSLALGGVLATSSIFSLNSLYIAVVGIMYLITSVSVIIQVLYFKKTKKRVFLMSPIHHHFQQKGYSESKIAYVYFMITLIISIICILFLLRS